MTLDGFDWTMHHEYLVIDSDGALVGESDYISDALRLASKYGAIVVTYVEPASDPCGDCYPVTIAPF